MFLYSFGTFAKKFKKKDFGDAIVQKQYVLRGTIKICLKNLDIETLLQQLALL